MGALLPWMLMLHESILRFTFYTSAGLCTNVKLLMCSVLLMRGHLKPEARDRPTREDHYITVVADSRLR